MELKKLSGNTLFHFTNNINNIVSILKNGFYPRFCFEDGMQEKEFSQLPDMIIPMVCFCDMRYTDAINGRHTKDYGYYAIGVTKEWAKSNGICPVLYSFPKPINNAKEISESFTQKSLGLIYNNTENIIDDGKYKEIESNIDSIINGLNMLFFCTKRYEGYLYKNWERKGDLITFYDEREWRYVCFTVETEEKKESIFNVLSSVLNRANFLYNTNEPIKVLFETGDQLIDKREYIALQNKEFEKQALTMTSDDIKYIIVHKTSEIQIIKNEIQKINHLKFDFDKIPIFSMENFDDDL